MRKVLELLGEIFKTMFVGVSVFFIIFLLMTLWAIQLILPILTGFLIGSLIYELMQSGVV